MYIERLTGAGKGLTRCDMGRSEAVRGPLTRLGVADLQSLCLIVTSYHTCSFDLQ